MLKKDILRTWDLVPGSKLKKCVECCRAPGVQAMVIHRFGGWLKQKNILVRILLEPFYQLGYYRMRTCWGIEIPRSAQIGEGFYIGHFGGITVSGAARIGKNVNISQQVTIGVSGQGDKRGVPVIGDNVYIAPGAKIFGRIRIGNNVKIGANAVIHRDIPDNATAVLDPGFKILPASDHDAVAMSAQVHAQSTSPRKSTSS
jgi:serine O-acetyltransferase